MSQYQMTLPRGRLLVRQLDCPDDQLTLDSFAVTTVHGATSNIGRFIPVPIAGQVDVSGRTFIHFSGGSRLYVQEANIDSANRVTISGGSFFEARGYICDVKTVRNYFVIATMEGLEFSM